MPVKLRRVLLLALVLASLAWSVLQQRSSHAPTASWPVTAVAPDVLTLGTLTLEPCNIGKRGRGVPTLRAYCTAFAVPEDRRQPQGRRIRLRIAVVRAAAAEADPDPVVFLDGGPGGAASEDYPAIAGAFEPLRKRHALLLIDQRGTGGSNALDCGAGDTGRAGDTVGDDATASDSTGGDAADGAAAPAATARALQQLHACLARLEPRAAPQFYATTDAVADLEDVRRALGAPRLDLIGVSYGTRVAQQYARRYPGAVRALILDSAVPNGLSLGSETARNLEDTLRALSERCRAQRGCAERFGDPYRTLQRVHARLQAGAQTVELRDPYTFQPQRRTITADSLAELVRLYAYSPYTAALLPYVLQEADAGRYAALLGQARIAVGDVEAQLNGGMGLSVACTEDADGLHADGADAHTVLGDSLTQWLLSACTVWPHGSRSADFGAPLRGALPALILAGELDPVTPPRYGAAILRTLPRGRLLRAAGQGHGLLGVGCMPRLLSEFIRTLDAAGLDARCLDMLAPTPSFQDANGAGP
jgi:pimeloyl-ACP methyl ester carboxylesterase